MPMHEQLPRRRMLCPIKARAVVRAALFLGVLANLPQLTLRADTASDAARREIERAGGTVEEVPAGAGEEPFLAVRYPGSDTSLAQLTSLGRVRWLDLSQSKVTDAGLTHVARLAELEVLYLGETRIGDAGLERLAALENLRGLYLQGAPVTSDGMRHLAGFTKLEWLNVSYTQVDSVGLARTEELSGARGLVAIALRRR